MRTQIIITLLAATASARPTPTNSARELQYSDIEAIYAAQHGGHGPLLPHEIQHSEILALQAEEEEARHHPQSHHQPPPELDGHGPYGHHRGGPESFEHHGHRDEDGHHHGELTEAEDHPRSHQHQGSLHGDILDNIFGFFGQQVRESLVMKWIFSSPVAEMRVVHEHQSHGPHGPHELRHPLTDVHKTEKAILDFLASTVR